MSPHPPSSQPVESHLDLPEGLKEYCLHYSRLTALGFIASAIMHELGNVLTVISGNAQILIMKNDSIGPEDILPRLERIMEQVDRAQAAMGRVGSFSTRVAGVEKNITTTTAVSNALFALKRRCNMSGVTLSADLAEEDDRAVRCDPTLLEFVLMELLASFWKYNTKGGRLEVKCSGEEAGWQFWVKFYHPPESSLPELEGDLRNLIITTLLAVEQVKGRLERFTDDTGCGWRLMLPWA